MMRIMIQEYMDRHQEEIITSQQLKDVFTICQKRDGCPP